MRHRRLWPLYAGGFLGPFGGAMVTPMLPELRDGLDTTLAVAASGLTVYLIPFAGLMVLSGTLAERWGRRRTVRTAYLVYAVASLGCALAPGPAGFLAGRAVQGAANAFTTPILVAAISDLVDRRDLGRSLGRYGSLQAAGQSFAPLIGGLAATVSWRWAFVATVLTSLALATAPPPDAQQPDEGLGGGRRAGGRGGSGDGGRWRALANPTLALACLVAALSYLTSMGLTTLGALLAGDRFGLGPDGRGLVVAVFGAAGLLGGSMIGRQLDRVGIRRFAVGGLAGMASAAVFCGASGMTVMLVAALALGGAAGTGVRVAVNSIAVHSTPANRGGATSMMLAWQFFGAALGPVLLIPLYHHDHVEAFLIAGATSVLAAVAVLVAPSRLLGDDGPAQDDGRGGAT